MLTGIAESFKMFDEFNNLKDAAEDLSVNVMDSVKFRGS